MAHVLQSGRPSRAVLRLVCLHKMADKLFTCKYKLRAQEAWHAFLELAACDADPVRFPFQKATRIEPGLLGQRHGNTSQVCF